MKHLERKLRDLLDLEDSGLVGPWDADEKTPWSVLSGNALCALVGKKTRVLTPKGPFEAFLTEDGDLLQFRGGPWKGYWKDDSLRTWAILRFYDPDLELSDTIYILHENVGRLTVREIKVPDSLDLEGEVGEALA